MIHSWQTNKAGKDDCNGYPSQVVHDHWNPNETCISFPWSEVNKPPLERDAAVLRNGAVMDIEWCHEAPPDPMIHPWKTNGAGHAWIIRKIFKILVFLGNPTLDLRIWESIPRPTNNDHSPLAKEFSKSQTVSGFELHYQTMSGGVKQIFKILVLWKLSVNQPNSGI